MPPKSFRELTPEQVLMLAIDVEEANGARLRTFADLFADYVPDAADLFAEMAAEEDEHRRQLETAYQQRYGELRRLLAEDDVLEVIEAADLDDAEHQVFDTLSLRRALETVLAAEQQAQAFYRQALENTDEFGLQAIYRELSVFETDHIQGIEARLQALEGSA